MLDFNIIDLSDKTEIELKFVKSHLDHCEDVINGFSSHRYTVLRPDCIVANIQISWQDEEKLPGIDKLPRDYSRDSGKQAIPASAR